MAKKIAYLTASLPQLVVYAETVLGLEFAHNIGEAKLRAKIAEAGFSGDEIEVEDDETETQPAKPLTPADVIASGRKRVRIVIQMQEGVPGGSEAVPIGVNGTVARVMRGVEVDVPAEYVEVLDNARKTVYGRDQDGRLTSPTQVHLYPFSILRTLED